MFRDNYLVKLYFFLPMFETTNCLASLQLLVSLSTSSLPAVEMNLLLKTNSNIHNQSAYKLTFFCQSTA